MAWMAMMGADSVEYHRATVIARADDHPGRALAYYASRGETPLLWGGAGAQRFGLAGAVTDEQYEAIFGPGGARDPTTGARLVATRRPGMDLVISAHKSVAELGVIGRAEDMHAILDAEREATMAYLDALTQTAGGRRGRARVSTPTRGLIYAHTRHATSRAGDPCPHDHVLVANVVEMADAQGGFKALDTTVVRDHLHAATMIGRMAGARKALELGYAIEADDGPSGKLGHWAIVGIPKDAQELHSKRASEIDQAVEEAGYSSYRARQVAAHRTRDVKRHTPVDELLPRWQAELTEAGYAPEQLLSAVTEAAKGLKLPRPLRPAELEVIVRMTLAPEGALAVRKVFHRRDVVVALAPVLFGRPKGELRRAVDAVLVSAEAVPLVRVEGARERAYACASVIAAETAIAEAVAQGAAATDGAYAPDAAVERALLAAEARLGGPLSQEQAEAVWGICGGGERVSLVLGVAGAGKTTALSCVADAYRSAGYEVLGTATSGQAARTLHREAGIEDSRTLASLTWRLQHRRLELSRRHAVILDEAGMTDDPALLRLLLAAQAARAKVVLVGDDRQLGPVGPGGALGALLRRHGGEAHILRNNLRQADLPERVALAQLRAGRVTDAVSWYVDNGRVEVRPDRESALEAMVEAWAGDALAGRETAMYAWRKANVDRLNLLAREQWREAGGLSGPELAAGARCYAAGDWVVTLAPGERGKLVTSERGVVERAQRASGELVVRMEDGRVVHMVGEELGADRLAHGYATTVHRAQGATVEVAHRFEDGGGRELAYVAMSRARERATAWVVADDLGQAAEDLAREWSLERRPRWAIDRGTPVIKTAGEPKHGTTPMHAATVRRARLEAECRALLAHVPPDPNPKIVDTIGCLTEVDQARRDLEVGRGMWRGTELGRAARHLIDIRVGRRQAEEFAQASRGRMRRSWRRTARQLAIAQPETEARFEELAAPERARLTTAHEGLTTTQRKLLAERTLRERWLYQHPEVEHRLGAIERELAVIDQSHEVTKGLGRERGLDHAAEIEPPPLPGF